MCFKFFSNSKATSRSNTKWALKSNKHVPQCMPNLLLVVLPQQQYQNQKSYPSTRYHCIWFLARPLQPPSTVFYGTKRKGEKLHETNLRKDRTQA